MSRDSLGFSVAPKMSRIMSINGHHAAIMRADKKEKDKDGLPSGVPIPCLPVDYLKERPSFWIPGSYVCPVSPDWGLWFNWQANRRDISILTSVKGMNPLTGQRISGLGLEQYKEQCPVHKVPLQHGKFCPECNFKWPDQNYITDPTPFYLDGFRSEDGVVRQFYFTEDMAKSVPEQVIGKDDTVPAFGFCFYKLKNSPRKFEKSTRLKDKIPEDWVRREVFTKRTTYLDTVRGSSGKICGSSITDSGTFLSCCESSPTIHLTSFRSPGEHNTSGAIYAVNSSSSEVKGFHGPLGVEGPPGWVGVGSMESVKYGSSTVIPDSYMGMSPEALGIERSYKGPVEVGVGAGAKIAQSQARDWRSLDEWQEKPAGIIRVYFVFQEEFEHYVEAGLNDLDGLKEGYLSGIPVGVSHE